MTRKELTENIKHKQSFLCVGLDPDPEKIPHHLKGSGVGILEFNLKIIEATARYAVAYKPNLAFYEAIGSEGYYVLESTCRFIREYYPDCLIIADAKRGDIGNTARMYAKAIFDQTDADVITVAPYMGEDSVKPFLEHEGKWACILALTSNKGSQDFQMLETKDGTRFFEKVVSESQKWGTPDNIMYVVGATRGELIADVRRLAPDHFFLVPGVGAQGGSLEEVCKYGFNNEVGLLVNSSRGIIHASQERDFAKIAEQKAMELQSQMASILKKSLYI